MTSDLDCLLKTWEVDYRCPLPLVDYFLEQNDPHRAAAAKWAYYFPPRPTAESIKDAQNKSSRFLYPVNWLRAHGDETDTYGWWCPYKTLRRPEGAYGGNWTYHYNFRRGFHAVLPVYVFTELADKEVLPSPDHHNPNSSSSSICLALLDYLNAYAAAVSKCHQR